MPLSDEHLSRTFDIARTLLQLERDEPVAPFVEATDLLADPRLQIGSDALPAQDVFTLVEDVVRLTPRCGSTRFSNQLFSGREPVGAMAEMLSALLNNSMYTYKAAGPHVVIEQIVAAHMARLAGFPEGEGIFTPGGSMSNLCAIYLALHAVAPDTMDEGLDRRRYIVYSSEQGHYSVAKGAALAGLGRNNVRLVPCDREGRMRPDELRSMITHDLATGATPCMINATAGTTVLGAFDPIAPLADIAQEHGIWLHVDGAFGGSAVLSPTTRHLVEGLDRADSFGWDAHKMMGLPLTCSIILTRRPGVLRATFDQDASYLFQLEGEDLFSQGRLSIQCGRRNDAFKLWAAWKHLGDAGWARRLEGQMEIARYAASIVRDDPDLVLTREPQWVNVCFEVRGKPSPEICESLRRSQKLIVGFAEVDDRRVIRIPFINDLLTEQDVRDIIRDIKDAAAPLPAADNAVRDTALAH